MIFFATKISKISDIRIMVMISDSVVGLKFAKFGSRWSQ